jgi:DNA-directed RNA polymerase subunit alpha
MLTFQKPKRMNTNTESPDLRYGSFSAAPFERGFGSTVGTALRRVLLSSIDGAAITAVRIEGVEHEFSPLPGVVEDATDIILNLKQVPFKMHSTEEMRTIRLRVDTPGEIFSGQLEVDSEVEILDPKVYLATVSEGGSLNIEMRLRSNRGYVSAERNSDEDLPLGYIPIDSDHSPVRKVNFQVETVRQGLSEYDKLNIELWTNGSIAPVDAVGQAAKLVKDHMAIFINFEDVPDISDEPAERAQGQMYEVLNRSVEELELSVRSYNCLKNANIQTIGDLVQKTEAEMLRTKNFGRKSLNEIKEILSGLNLSFGMRYDAQGRLVGPSGPVSLADRPEDDDLDIDGDDESLDDNE